MRAKKRLNFEQIFDWFGSYSPLKVINCELEPKIYHLFFDVIPHLRQYPYWLGLKKRDFSHLFRRLSDDLLPAVPPPPPVSAG